MDNNHVLLIWELVPEEHWFYVIPSKIADKYEKFLKEAHNNFINHGDWDKNDGLNFLNTALSEEWAEEGFEEYYGVLKSFKVDISKPIIGKVITKVYLSGFILY